MTSLLCVWLSYPVYRQKIAGKATPSQKNPHFRAVVSLIEICQW